ncbi:MAG: adenosylmethionine--8-amino-7-oxononanoate transaminase, partial [Proteobacteria bacterium]|nr:adenosylmethionine--8-amino-7-oxononanoate transaminase [Pseudomonadota bacterium]
LIDPPPVFPVVGAQGCRLQLADGRELIDGMASWWSAIHGYRHPTLDAAVQDQLERMAHVMFGGLAHEGAAELARTLVDITPAGLEHVFFSDSGSVAVEVAIKMALQYRAARREPARQKLLTVRGGYHGDTFGAMAVCDPVTGMHSLFNTVLPEHIFAPRPDIAFHEPWQDQALTDLRELAEFHADSLTAIILEPVVQGAGGMWFYHPSYLAGVREICDEFGLLLIADEIATGFGRTGRLFACEHADVTPDILCLGKALTGGYMTLAATLVSSEVAHTICSAEPGRVHAVRPSWPTRWPAPAARPAMQLVLDSDWSGNVHRIETALARGLEPCRTLRQVADVRCLGAIGVIELERPVDMRSIPHAFVNRGVWLRPFGKLVYVMPPYIISDEELTQLTSAMVEVVSELP